MKTSPPRTTLPTAVPPNLRDRGGREPRIRINHMIRVPRIRVIDPDGKQLGILNTEDALRMAREQFNLDLVEISPTAQPPVCKILDFGKYKYQQKKKAQEAKRNQSVIEVKEVKLRPQTDIHDINFKVNHIRRFLQEGNKAKITVFFRGREVVYSQHGKELLQKVFTQVQDLGSMEQEPFMEGRYMSIIVAPKGVATVKPAGATTGKETSAPSVGSKEPAKKSDS